MERPQRVSTIATSLLAAALGGCAGDDPAAPGGPGPIPTDVTTPSEAIESHVRAIREMDADAYVALLEPAVEGNPFRGFRFYPRADELDDLFPWVSGDSWDHETESAALGNMTNPAFDGSVAPLQSLRIDYRVVEEQVLGDRAVTTIDAGIEALLAPETGWLAQTRLVVTLALDSSGYYRIRSVREERTPTPIRAASSVETTSWARIKATYLDASLPPDNPVDLRDPLAVLAGHARSVERRNFAAYAALLTEDFEFFLRPDDVDDFPWLPDGIWDLGEELAVMANMMDPNFQGQERPVRSMEFEYTLLGKLEEPGSVELTVNADITVLVAADTGWLATTRLVFLLAEDEHGEYRIRSIRERPILEPRASVEESSFASIKGLYR